MQSLVERTVAHGRLDIMVNNAGIGYLVVPLVEMDQASWTQCSASTCAVASSASSMPRGR
ncbi:MAG: hypothetical protein U1F18_06150 [Steroidobacteraceae bacterium]